MSSPEKFWEGLARAIDRPELFQDPRFADRRGRITNQNVLIDLMTPIFRKQSRANWCVRLEGEGVPFSPVYDSSEALQDPQAKHLGIQIEAQHPTMGRFRTVRFPVNFDGQHLSEVQPPPTLGEHNETIRADRNSGRTRQRKRPDAAE
jgi:crotonobetainyl-CoA:carnitine CoA-transferase CaiB-like acyl-CoA transferase